MKTISFIWALVLLCCLTGQESLHALELNSWPRDITLPSGVMTVYQPQVESLDNNILKGRAALAYKKKGTDAPLFGVAWFSSRVNIDRDERLVHYETLDITNIRFPEDNAALAAEFRDAVQHGLQKEDLQSSLDELTTGLAAVKQTQQEAGKLKTAPPDIIYKDKPALLVSIDGKAVLQKIKGSGYQSVANTPYPLFFDGKRAWYLNVAENVWYKAGDVDGPWAIDADPPKDLAAMVRQQQEKQARKGDGDEGQPQKIAKANAPAIVVVHRPTELIVSDGKATFQPLTNDLLVMSNTNSRVFMDVTSQHYFLVASGRWYQAKSMDGKWQYVAADKLPATFSKIPKDSKYADVRAYVAGTDEAKEAVIDAQIPQTAAVKRGTVDIKVSYDGAPKFEKIPGTELSFALNCSETVIYASKENSYYLVKDAVWYISSTASGPWQVSDHVPPDIAKVPPSSPVYNTKYVYVYDATPEVVYVGYTPGYLGSYVYGPTIVYGTGWYYSPWVSPLFYYPRPATWGFCVSYNPWTGWGFGLSWSSGPFHVGFYSGGGWHGPYWGSHWYGPGGYRPSFNQVNINRNNININRNTYNSFSRHNNLYRNGSQAARVRDTVNARPLSPADRQQIHDRAAAIDRPGGRGTSSLMGAAAGGALGPGAVKPMPTHVSRPTNTANNVFSDREGNVLRNNNGQWQQQVNGRWQDNMPPQGMRPPSQPRSGYDRPSSLDRDQFSRQRAMERSHSFQGRMGGGGFHGGGRFR